MVLFKYQPLSDQRSIRLVRVVQDGKAAHGFTLQLFESSLKTEFQALSYTWGLPFHEDVLDLQKPNSRMAETFRVGCNDAEVAITENLFYALTQLIGNACGDPISPIWIDAISIDQSNEAEKSSQVSMMSDIYSAAARVVVWLGKDDPPPRFLALHSNMKLEQYLTDVGLGNLGGIPTTKVLESMGMASLQEWQNMWWDYACFYRRHRYFRRVWIIQETALAKSLTVLCGTKTLSWTQLVIIGNLFHVSKIEDVLHTWGSDRMATLSRVQAWKPGCEIRQLHVFRASHFANGGLPAHLHEYKLNFMTSRKSDVQINDSYFRTLGALGDKCHWEYANLLWILSLFRGYQATDKRDIIFAALAFCQPLFRHAGMDPPMTPDYSMSIRDVFIQVTKILIQGLPTLTVLSLVDENQRRLPDLPSWVPDFTAPGGYRALISRGCTRRPSAASSTVEYEPIYNAARTPIWPSPFGCPSLAIFAPSNVLHLRGACVGVVADICPGPDMSDGHMTYFPYLEWAPSVLPKTYPDTGETWDEVLWRTMFGNFYDLDHMYPASAEAGAVWFRTYVLESLAAVVISKLTADGDMGPWMAEFMRLAGLLATLNYSGRMDTFIPNPVDLSDQVTEYMTIAAGSVNQDQVMENDVALIQPDHFAINLGTSRAERECKFMSGMGMSLGYTKLYTTCEGRLGVGPPAMRKGDEVWVIRGARVPFILRRCEAGFTLVGETYLHGVMDGEMVGEGREGLVDVVLC